MNNCRFRRRQPTFHPRLRGQGELSLARGLLLRDGLDYDLGGVALRRPAGRPADCARRLPRPAWTTLLRRGRLCHHHRHLLMLLLLLRGLGRPRGLLLRRLREGGSHRGAFDDYSLLWFPRSSRSSPPNATASIFRGKRLATTKKTWRAVSNSDWTGTDTLAAFRVRFRFRSPVRCLH